jgi:hypothetical protein
MRAHVVTTPVLRSATCEWVSTFGSTISRLVTWRDAATGHIIAKSDLFVPLSPGSLITPGFGRRVNFPR